MDIPPYILVGMPRRDTNGRGKRAASYSQRFRLLHEKRPRSVSLKTADRGVATGRAKEFVEQKIRKLVFKTNPVARTAHTPIKLALDEYIADLSATGNTEKQAKQVKNRILRIIKQAGYAAYVEVDAVTATKAIASLQEAGQFKTTATANKHREAMRAWSRWMKRNGRWSTNVLEDMDKFKGDTDDSRPKAILTSTQLERLIDSTRQGPMRRNLFGEERAWLYFIAAQTGLRASELDSLTPASFYLRGPNPFVEIRCTVSKRRTTDRVDLQPEFAQMLSRWLAKKPNGERLWARSKSWADCAARMLRADLEAADLPTTGPTENGTGKIGFHSFRCYRVTKLVETGATTAVVLKTVRLSTESLLHRYNKVSPQDVSDCVAAVPMPNVAI